VVFKTGLKEIQSARGLAHSTTLRAVWSSLENATASWTAVALHRFSTTGEQGRQKIANGIFFRPIRGFICLCMDTHGFTIGYFRSSLRDFK
jgi:hypothetical protein